MKTKKELKNNKLKNFTDEELLVEIANRKFQGKNGFPDPISASCFKCQKQFWIKFVVPQKDYSKKNITLFKMLSAFL